jgi:hypothetical protein
MLICDGGSEKQAKQLICSFFYYFGRLFFENLPENSSDPFFFESSTRFKVSSSFLTFFGYLRLRQQVPVRTFTGIQIRKMASRPSPMEVLESSFHKRTVTTTYRLRYHVITAVPNTLEHLHAAIRASARRRLLTALLIGSFAFFSIRAINIFTPSFVKT